MVGGSWIADRFSISAHSLEQTNFVNNVDASPVALMAARRPSHSWDRFGDSEAETDDFQEIGIEAGALFVEMLLGLHFAGHLSAKSLCVL